MERPRTSDPSSKATRTVSHSNTLRWSRSCRHKEFEEIAKMFPPTESSIGAQLSSVKPSAPAFAMAKANRTDIFKMYDPAFSGSVRSGEAGTPGPVRKGVDTPGPKYSVTLKSSTASHSFGEGRSAMYDERVDGNRTGPGSYNSNLSSVGKQVSSQETTAPYFKIKADKPKTSLFDNKSNAYDQNMIFTRIGTESKGPGAYSPKNESSSTVKTEPSFSFGGNFIHEMPRPPWVGRSADAYTDRRRRGGKRGKKKKRKGKKKGRGNNNEGKGRARRSKEKRLLSHVPSSVGSQHVSGKPSLPAYMFSHSTRHGPETWVAGPEIVGGQRTPGPGAYTASTGRPSGLQFVSERKNAPSFGFGSGKRFDGSTYLPQADFTRRHDITIARR